MTDDRSKLAARVNRIYWETDTPVTEMAEELGISRRSIYDMLEPATAHERCPVCGGELTYANRSARMAGEAVCRECGHVQDLTLLRELAAAEAAERSGGGEPMSTGTALVPRSVVTLQRRLPPSPHISRPALAAFILGSVAAALLAALLVPRRRRRWGWWGGK